MPTYQHSRNAYVSGSPNISFRIVTDVDRFFSPIIRELILLLPS